MLEHGDTLGVRIVRSNASAVRADRDRVLHGPLYSESRPAGTWAAARSTTYTAIVEHELVEFSTTSRRMSKRSNRWDRRE